MWWLSNSHGGPFPSFNRNGKDIPASQYVFNPQGTPNENWNLVKQINATVFDLGLPSAYSSRGNVVFTAPLPPQNNPVPGARPYIGVIYPGWLLGTGIPFPAFQTNVGTLIAKGDCQTVVTSHPGDPTQ
jgi:hypothetical protein